jgi:ribosomal-protein-alanine acetyltransferase
MGKTRRTAPPRPRAAPNARGAKRLVLRRARPGDLAALVALEQQAFTTDRLSRRQYRRHLHSASATLLVAAAGRRLLGKALVFFRRGSHRARLYSIAVHAQARGRGVGTALLRAAERAARARGCSTLSLEVRADNARAIRWYERHGYRRFGAHPGFYEDGADAWRYAKRWPPAD